MAVIMTRRYTIRAQHAQGKPTGYYEVLEASPDVIVPHVLCRCQIALDADYLANLLNELTDAQRLHALQQLEA